MLAGIIKSIEAFCWFCCEGTLRSNKQPQEISVSATNPLFPSQFLPRKRKPIPSAGQFANMSWKIKMKARKAPSGMEKLIPFLNEHENELREALNQPPEDKRRNEITWPIYKLHYQKNRHIYTLFRDKEISKQLLDYLIKEKMVDGKLIAKWKRPGYERLCSVAVITSSNMKFGGVGVCRIPLRQRRGQIMPNVITGCVSCASGDGGPIWWDDPVPDIVKQRIAEIDPGKKDLVEEMEKEEKKKEAEKEKEKENVQVQEQEQEQEQEDGDASEGDDDEYDDREDVAEDEIAAA